MSYHILNPNPLPVKSNNDITIKEADKGSTVMFMNTEHYKNSVSNSYKTLRTNYERVVNYQR